MGREPLIMPAGKPETIHEAVRVLREGGIVALPTDTVYGLVALYDSEEAVQRIYELKGRPPRKPLPLLLASAAELALVTPEVPAHAWKLIDRFWPGPLTLVFKRQRHIPEIVTGGLNTVGVRVPNLPAALEILEALELPVASTSANRSGALETTTTAEVLHQLPYGIDLIVAYEGSQTAGRPSTVVDLTQEPPVILRQGALSADDIRQALGMRVERKTE
jgi:L-threonylcarbamoyladenylate synthase